MSTEDDELGVTLTPASIIRLRSACHGIESLPGNIARRVIGNRRDRQQAGKYPIQFQNKSGDSIPPHACIKVDQTTSAGALTGESAGVGLPVTQVIKPDTTLGIYLLNGPNTIVDNDFGFAADAGAYLFRYAGSSPGVGAGYGPVPGSWDWGKGYPQMIEAIGDYDSSSKFANGLVHQITTALIRFTGSVSNNTSTTSYKIYAGTMGSESDAGFTTVPSARNRTGSRVNNDWALLVRINDGWEIVNLLGTSSDAEIFHLTLSGSVADGATTTITSPIAGSVTAINEINGQSISGKVTAYKDAGDGTYQLLKTGGGTSYGIIEGGVGMAFTKTTIAFLANVIHDDDGNLSLGDQVMVWNPYDPKTGNLVFEGEQNAACQFRYSPSDELYRAIWVACPDNEGVQVGVGGEGSQSINLGSYGYGGQPDIVSNVYFGEV